MVGKQQPSLNIEYPDPNDPAIVDLAVAGSIVRRPERPKVYGGPKKRLEEEEAMEEEEMTLELDEESSNEDAKSERDAEEMEVAATEEDDETGTIQDVWI